MSTRMPSPAHEAIAYPYETWPAPATSTAVASGVHWLRMPLPFVLNHINLWLLEDDGGWSIVDSGLCTPQIRDLWLALHAGVMGGRPVRRLIITHYHPDHFGQAAWLMEQFGCELWMTGPEYRMAARAITDDDYDDDAMRLAFFQRHGLQEDRLQVLRSWGGSYRRGVAGLPAGFMPLHDGTRLTIGGHEWQVITGQGHSPDHATLYCAALGLLIAGDQVLPGITPHVGVWHFEPDADPIRLYLASLERFTGLPPDTLVLPAHGAPFTGLHPRLAALAGHHAQRFDLLVHSCSQSRSAADVLAPLFRRRLSAHQLYFAMSEAIAHLNHLHFDGRLVRTHDADDRYRYQRA